MYFRDIIGLHEIKRHLIDTVNQDIVPHARVFHGPGGVGKLPLAIAYARYLNCSHRGEDDSCGECPSCHKFDKLAHPDLHFVFPVVKSKVSDEYLPEWREMLSKRSYFDLGEWLRFIDAQNAQGLIYEKESAEIIRKLNLKVYEAPYKVMIVWLPEKMHQACANKLLKMIEEPPAHTVFILVTEDTENVLQTIWSRCQPLHVRALEMEEMVEALQRNFDLNADHARSAAHIARGSYTKAMGLVHSSDENGYFFNLFVQMTRASFSGNIKTIKQVANEIAGIGREMQKSFLLYSLRMFREYFISNLGQPSMVYLNRDEQQFGERFAPFINERNIENLYDEFSLAHRHVEQNGNAKIIFLDLCLKVTLFLRK